MAQSGSCRTTQAEGAMGGGLPHALISPSAPTGRARILRPFALAGNLPRVRLRPHGRRARGAASLPRLARPAVHTPGARTTLVPGEVPDAAGSARAGAGGRARAARPVVDVRDKQRKRRHCGNAALARSGRGHRIQGSGAQPCKARVCDEPFLERRIGQVVGRVQRQPHTRQHTGSARRPVG